MDSALLNIWRENGAYLRFGDAKNGFLAGVASTLLYAYLSHILIVDDVGWHTMSRILESDQILASQAVVVVSFFAGAFFTTLSIIPVLTKNSVRINAVLAVAAFFGTVREPNELGIIFFLDIAGFGTADKYRERIEKSFDTNRIDGSLNANLIEQIWIVSRIASAKHFVFLASTVLVLFGIILSIFS